MTTRWLEFSKDLRAGVRSEPQIATRRFVLDGEGLLSHSEHLEDYELAPFTLGDRISPSRSRSAPMP